VFTDLPDLLRPTDVLVVNDTKVLPVRLRGRRDTGGQVEVLLLRPQTNGAWEVLLKPGRRVRAGTHLVFSPHVLEGTVGPRTPSGTWVIELRHRGDLRPILDTLGEMPVPPYIERALDDPMDYQTVYAAHEGAVAAPTAGLHFTETLLDALRRRGVRIVALTLHVGLGTFRPVTTEEVTRHRMEAEYYEVSPGTAHTITAARQNGDRIIVVGTTAVRTLESIAAEDGAVGAGRGWTDVFITPGFRFRVTDAMITNFHLPRTTLLMLVSAFAGRERILAAYEEAIRLAYRFYSFGDAMLIW